MKLHHDTLPHMLAIITLLLCCHSASAQGIYTPGREFVYEVVYVNSNDTTRSFISLQAIDSVWEFDNSQRVLRYNRWPLDGVMETTGYIENEKTVWLHPPRSGYFAILEYFPFPEVALPIKCKRSYSRWFIGHIDFLDRFAILRYRMHIECHGDTTIITARSQSGRWKATYCFTPTEGFTNMEFSFDNTTLIMTLIEICE